MPDDDSPVATLVGDLEWIISDLDSMELPVLKKAIRAAQANREQIAPKLCDVLSHATQQARAGHMPSGNAHIIAVLLLAEFEAREALPALLESIQLPGRLARDLYEDFITEDLPRALAVLVGDDDSVLDGLIWNDEIYDFVRWAAGTTYVRLICDGKRDRAVVVQKLREHLQRAVRDRKEVPATQLVNSLLDLGAAEATSDIEAAYDAEIIDESITDRQYALEILGDGEDMMRREFNHLGPSAVLDTYEEVCNWHCYRPRSRDASLRTWTLPAAATLGAGSLDDEHDGHVPARGRLERVRAAGRNDPCPCGSGKKYKKCCGLRAS